ncbi:hypothetical protein DV515_00017612 [Chloebia gouldiae]|uniref:Uncharacterized protein n=1 Tax=Chloebia gouldiae TaxID=44316 RepID=A0A3L8Q9T0_CHLGU|nr:hypothetical protein DV515_00017612 [Chloebia gouldiae]
MHLSQPKDMHRPPRPTGSRATGPTGSPPTSATHSRRPRPRTGRRPTPPPTGSPPQVRALLGWPQLQLCLAWQRP